MQNLKMKSSFNKTKFPLSHMFGQVQLFVECVTRVTKKSSDDIDKTDKKIETTALYPYKEVWPEVYNLLWFME